MTGPAFGIFARVFPPDSPRNVAEAIAGAGYQVAQLNLKALGLPVIPSSEEWRQVQPDTVRADFAASGVSIWGLSCSYNMAHPDPAIRRAGTTAAIGSIDHAAAFGATAVTLCTGSRDPVRMWAAHPDNTSAEAWSDMRRELDLLLAAARAANVMLAIEPEPGNVVRDADAAVRLYSELGGDARSVGIILDSANLLAGHPPQAHADVLDHAFSALAEHVVCLHAKDLVSWQETLADRGMVDYAHVASLYARLGLTSPVIVQDVSPQQARSALVHLRRHFGADASTQTSRSPPALDSVGLHPAPQGPARRTR